MITTRAVSALLGAIANALLVQQVPPAVFRSTTDTVRVWATVTNAEGRAVTGLAKNDFTVLEDGEQRPITTFSTQPEPISVGIVLDASGSMAGPRIHAATAVIDHLISESLNPADELFFTEFGYSASLTQQWTMDRAAIHAAVAEVHPTGDTALYDALALALPTAESGRYDKRALLLISDGEDTRSAIRLPELQQMIVSSEVLVYALAMDASGSSPRANVPNLRKITVPTGGRTVAVRDIGQLREAADEIAQELQHHYALGFVPIAHDGRQHSIQVRVRRHAVTVRARTEFRAASR